MKDGFKSDSLEHRTHINLGRKFGKSDYEHADESKHLSHKEKNESHFKHEEMLD